MCSLQFVHTTFKRFGSAVQKHRDYSRVGGHMWWLSRISLVWVCILSFLGKSYRLHLFKSFGSTHHHRRHQFVIFDKVHMEGCLMRYGQMSEENLSQRWLIEDRSVRASWNDSDSEGGEKRKKKGVCVNEAQSNEKSCHYWSPCCRKSHNQDNIIKPNAPVRSVLCTCLAFIFSFRS